MKCVCPKCRKVTEMSAGELRAQSGNVVCPQCLNIFIVRPPEPQPNKTDKTLPPPVPERYKRTEEETMTKKNSNQASASVAYCNQCGTKVAPATVTCPSCGHSLPGMRHAQGGKKKTPPVISFVQNQPAIRPRQGAHHHPPQPSTRKSSKPKSSSSRQTSTTWLGCAGYSIAIVAAFFLLYFLIGQLSY